MSEVYFELLNDRVDMLEQSYLADDSKWDQAYQDLVTHIDKNELDKYSRSIKESAKTLSDILKAHIKELKEIDNDVVNGKAIDKYRDATAYNMVFSCCFDVRNVQMRSERSEHLDWIKDNMRNITKNLANTVDLVKSLVSQVIDFANNPESIHDFKWLNVLTQVNEDASEQFGARRLEWFTLNYQHEVENYLLGPIWVPDEEDFDREEEWDPMAFYWRDVLGPGYDVLKKEYEERLERQGFDPDEDYVDNDDLNSFVYARWPELYAEYIQPHKSEVINKLKSVHASECELWMKALHENSGKYGLTDVAEKTAESVIESMFESSVDEWTREVFNVKQSCYAVYYVLSNAV